VLLSTPNLISGGQFCEEKEQGERRKEKEGSLVGTTGKCLNITMFGQIHADASSARTDRQPDEVTVRDATDHYIPTPRLLPASIGNDNRVSREGLKGCYHLEIREPSSG